MYLKYNAALRHKGMMNSDATAESKEYSERQFQELCVGNYYVSTLHAINSSVVKLGSERCEPNPPQLCTASAPPICRSSAPSAPSAPCTLCTIVFD